MSSADEELEAKILAERTAAFLNLWLPAAAPGVNTHLPTGYLRDFYPNIWHYGPHGDTYVNQLRAIRDHLDAAYRHPNVSPAYPLLDDAPRFIKTFNPQNYLGMERIKAAINTERRLQPPYAFLDYNLAVYPLQREILQHQIFTRWANAPLNAHGRLGPPIRNLIRTFTFHSLNRDLIRRYEPDNELDKRYILYCRRWSIPW